MRFTLFGFPVHVRATFWLTPLLLAMPSRMDAAALRLFAVWAVVAFLSVLVHELGHALAMRRFGRTASITLEALGGRTAWGTGPVVGAWASAFVSFAGPLAGFVFALPFGALLLSGLVKLPAEPARADAGTMLVALFLWANLGWGLLNLLPILPFDGGRVVQAVLTALFGLPGAKAARVISLGLAVTLGVVALWFGAYWGAFLAFFGAQQTVREPLSRDGSVPALRHATPTEISVEEAARKAWEALWEGYPDQAEAVLGLALARVPTEEVGLRDTLTSILAWVHLDRGDDETAAALAATLQPEAVSPLLAARLRYARGDVEGGVEALREAHAIEPTAHSAAVLGGVLMDLGRYDEVPDVLSAPGDGALPPFVFVKLSAALFFAEAYEASLAIDRHGWQRFRLPAFAHNGACALVRLGRSSEAIDLLEDAAQVGALDPMGLRDDTDLAPLRADARFVALLEHSVRDGSRARQRRRRVLTVATVIAVVAVLVAAWSKGR